MEEKCFSQLVRHDSPVAQMPAYLRQWFLTLGCKAIQCGFWNSFDASTYY